MLGGMKPQVTRAFLALTLVFALFSCTPKQEGDSVKPVSTVSSDPAAVTDAPAVKAPDGTLTGQPANAGAGTPAVDAPASSMEPQAGAAAPVSSDSVKPQASSPPPSGPDPAQVELARLKAINVSPPMISKPAGIYPQGFEVTLSTPIPEARMAYTLDGSEPTPERGKPYSGPVKISASGMLKAIAFVPKGKSSSVAAVDYAVGEAFASPNGGGAGTKSAPFPTLNAALEAARKAGIGTVKAAVGTYRETVILRDPILLSGGWDAGFQAKSDARSVVMGEGASGTGKKAPGFALKAEGSAAVKVERFEFRGGEASYSAGAFITDSSRASFISCSFSGGDGSYGYGASVSGNASPSFSFCSFDGGGAPSGYGIAVDSGSAALSSCALYGGTGTVTGAGASITDGRIIAVSSVFSGNGANTSYGVALYNSKDSSFEGCTLWGGSGRDATAAFISAGNPELLSCLIASGGARNSYGIYDNYGDSAPKSVRNCAFSGCAFGIYFDADAKAAYSEISREGAFMAGTKRLARPQAEASARVELTLSSAPQCRTPSDAPAFVAKEGLAPKGHAFDAAGRQRTAPYSVGAYEVD